jgi:hypothetical protein
VSPIPYVRAQVVVLAGLVGATGLFDSATLAICCGIASLVWLLLMRQKYLWDVSRTGADKPDHRTRLDNVVVRDAARTLLPMTLLAAVFLLGLVSPLANRDAIYGTVSALVPAATVIWASSLVDWYIILPRISGQLGPRPCQAATEAAQFPFPATWKEATRWWYVHRVAATFAFRVGLSTALAVAIGNISGLHNEARWFAGVAMLLFSGYAISTLSRGVSQIGHAKAIVSETVRVDRRAGRRRKWWPFSKLPPLQFDGRYYVVDIAIESVQLVSAETYEAELLPTPEKFARHPDSVSLANIDAIHQASAKFAGCGGRCSGINWYCIENPRCFEPK